MKNGVAVSEWGNAIYVNLNVGSAVEYRGASVRLLGINGDTCTVQVDGEQAEIAVARRGLPVNIGGVRVFAADNRVVKGLTTDNELHGLTTGDALLCLSDPAQPLLDPKRYCFPISRRDGFVWTMEESSHMYAYLGLANWIRPGYYRSHEGIDINLHDARGLVRHPLVAIEAGTVCWVEQCNAQEGCILLQSESQPDIYYVYKHTCNWNTFVRPGQHVERGEELACIWGDGHWGHLHFAVISRPDLPRYQDRHQYLMNCFPQLYELWHGSLEPSTRLWPGGDFTFGRRDYWSVKNRKRKHGFCAPIGYGWLLGPWCPAQSVEPVGTGAGASNVRLRKTLHRGTAAEAENPADYFDFEVAVAPGTYQVKALVGDWQEQSWQEVLFEGKSVGVFDPAPGQYRWTPEVKVNVTDGRLTVRLYLRDQDTAAGLSELLFTRTA